MTRLHAATTGLSSATCSTIDRPLWEATAIAARQRIRGSLGVSRHPRLTDQSSSTARPLGGSSLTIRSQTRGGMTLTVTSLYTLSCLGWVNS